MPAFRQQNLTVFLVNTVIAGAIFFLLTHQLWHQFVHADINVHIIFSLARNNQRCTRLIDQNGIHLIHDGIIQFTLKALTGMGSHIVAQIIKAKFVVGAVGYIRTVSSLLIGMVHLRQNYPY